MNLFKRPGPAQEKIAAPPRICMHVQGVARNDPRVMREATTLLAAGFAVTIVDIEGDGTRPPTEEIQGVCLKHVRMPGWYISTRFPWSLFKAARMFIRTLLGVARVPADGYHAHDVPALPACYIAARLRHKPLVFDAHELPLAEMPLSKMSKSRRSIHSQLARIFVRMLPRCAGVIATSSMMGLEMVKRYGCQEVTVVRNFPFYAEASRTDLLRKHLKLDAGVRIALYQGNIQPDRELDRIVCAARFLAPNTVIVMMGKAESETLAQLEALLATEGVAERVKIIPPVPYDELLSWTASADIGLSIFAPDYTPHMRVCLPNKLFEYLMAGLPVLSSAMEAVAEVVHDYHVGRVVSSLEPAEIGAAINAMLADDDDLARMRSNALQAARSEFYWEKERQQLVRLYRQVLSPSISPLPADPTLEQQAPEEILL